MNITKMASIKALFIELEEEDNNLLPILEKQSENYAICGMVMLPQVGRGEVDTNTAQQHVLTTFKDIRQYCTALYAFFGSKDATVYPWTLPSVTQPPKYGSIAVFEEALKRDYQLVLDFSASLIVSNSSEFEEMAIETGIPFMTREEWLNA